MKKIITCLALLAVLYSCKTGSSGSPKNTVESFIEASKSGNLDEVKKYISKSDVSLLEMGQRVLANIDPAKSKEMQEKMSEKFKEKTKDAKIDIGDEKIDGNNATVNVAFMLNGKSEEHPFSLVKEDGQWKISLISTGMNNSGASDEDKDKILKNLNLDSIQGSISKGMEELNKIDKDSLKQAMNEALKEVDKLDNDSLKKVIKDKMKELEKLKDIPKKE